MASNQIAMEQKIMAKARTRLQALREANKWSRSDLLNEAIRKGHDLTYQTIMAWENNDLSRIDMNTAAIFADALGCKWSELFDPELAE